MWKQIQKQKKNILFLFEKCRPPDNNSRIKFDYDGRLIMDKSLKNWLTRPEIMIAS